MRRIRATLIPHLIMFSTRPFFKVYLILKRGLTMSKNHQRFVGIFTYGARVKPVRPAEPTFLNLY